MINYPTPILPTGCLICVPRDGSHIVSQTDNRNVVNQTLRKAVRP